MSRHGVLLMAHGTPESLDDMPEYLRVVRGGRLPSDELVEEMRHNYAAIGGRSPLTDLTRAQAAALAERLGPAVPVAIGMRNWTPHIRQGLQELAAGGVETVVAIPLAPQFSSLSIAKYFDAADAVLPAGMRLERVPSYFEHPLLVRAFAERLTAARPRPDEEVIFTAHSLPSRVIRGGDPYAMQVAQTARGIAARCGLARYWRAYQSAGRTPEPWIGLDLGDFLRHRVARGARAFLVQPVGFVCDHTEILFDIDVQAAAIARELGVSLRRTESLNTLPAFIDLLEAVARSRLPS
jgi:ferrochelatase